MSDELELRAKSIFQRALEDAPGQRAAFVQRECAGDAELRRRVEALLATFDEADGFLAASALAAAEEDAIGSRIGPYLLLEHLGAGGFGDVYLAEQTAPVRRQVALKLIKRGMDSRQVLARFEAEREALARMEHPNIARVLDAGTCASGQPYFVMELVRGVRITDFCDAAGLDLDARLALVETVCRAVQHSHQKGVIHRDLKPSNILVELHDGRPVPKIIDFGIAKATGPSLGAETVLTTLYETLGTPEYMAPEQADLGATDVDTRVDVYSLGVLAYELATGTRPIERKSILAAGRAASLRVIRETEPPRPLARLLSLDPALLDTIASSRATSPAALKRLLRGDLEWVVMKAMERDRERRYETANGLAMDLERYRRKEPVVAGPPSPAYRLRKYVQRHRLAVTAGSFVLLALVAGALLATSGYLAATASAAEARTERRAAEAATRRAEGERLSALAAGFAADDPTLALLLAREGGRLAPGLAASSVLLTALGGHYESATLVGHDAYVFDAAFDPSGTRVLTVAQEPDALIWDLASRGVLQRLAGHTEGLTGGAFDAAGERVLTSSLDGTARLYDARSGAPLAVFEGATGPVHRARFSPDGTRVVTAGDDGRVRVYDVTTASATQVLEGHAGPVLDAVWLPGGGGVVSISFDQTVRVWELDPGAPARVLQVPVSRAITRWSYSSAWLSLSADGGLLYVWGGAGGGPPSVFELSSGAPVAPAGLEDAVPVACSEGARRVAWSATAADGVTTLEVRDSESGAVLWSDLGGIVFGTRFLDPGGRYLAHLAGTGTDFEVIDLDAGEVLARCRAHGYKVLNVAMSPDRRSIVSAGADGTARVWDLERATRRNVLRPSVRSVGAWQGVHLARGLPWIVVGGLEPGAGDADRFRALVLDVRTGERVRELWTRRAANENALTLASAADRLFLLDPDGHGVVRDLATGAELGAFDLPVGADVKYCLSPGGTRLAVRRHVDGRSDVQVHDVASGAPLGPVCRLPAPSSHFRCTDDGSVLLTAHGSVLPVVIVWDVRAGRELRRCVGHTGHIEALEITPDGATAATRAVDGTLRVWDVATGATRAICRGIPRTGGTRIALHDDGGTVAAIADEVLLLYDARSGELLARGEQPSELGTLVCVWFAAGGGELVTLDTEARLRWWPVDPLVASGSLQPRALSPKELERFRVGTSEERAERVRAWVAAHDSSKALCAWGARCLERGDLDGADAAFERAVELRASSAEGHMGHATVHALRAAAATDAEQRSAELDQGLAALARALEHAEPGRVYDPNDPRLEVLRADPRSAGVLALHGR